MMMDKILVMSGTTREVSTMGTNIGHFRNRNHIGSGTTREVSTMGTVKLSGLSFK